MRLVSFTDFASRRLPRLSLPRLSLPRLRRAGVLFAASLALAGATCSQPQGNVDVRPATADVSWSDALAEHTRSVRVWNLLLMEARLKATLVTPALRSAYLQNRVDFHGRFAKDLHKELVGYGQRPDEGVDAEMMSGPEGESELLVIASFYVADRINKDLNSSYSVWDTRLVRGDTEVEATKIESLHNDPAVVEVLPYVDRFDDVYLLRFPLVGDDGGALMGPGDDELRLEIRSAKGTAAVSWSLQGTGPAAEKAKPLPTK